MSDLNVLCISCKLAHSGDVTSRELLASVILLRLLRKKKNIHQPPLSLMLSGVMEDFCTETRYCHGVKSERIHLHYSPGLQPLPFWCLYRDECTDSLCICTGAYVVSTATDADGISLMVLSNHLQITARTVCPKDWIGSKREKIMHHPAA